MGFCMVELSSICFCFYLLIVFVIGTVQTINNNNNNNNNKIITIKKGKKL